MTEEVSAANFATLQQQLVNLNKSVEKMGLTMEHMAADTRKIAVLEERNQTQGEAINRAFAEIVKIGEASKHANLMLSERIDEMEAINDAAHEAYNKWIWLVTGFVVAVCTFWTIFGVHFSSVLDDVMKTTVKMQVHLETDKVTSTEQVQQMIKEK